MKKLKEILSTRKANIIGYSLDLILSLVIGCIFYMRSAEMFTSYLDNGVIPELYEAGLTTGVFMMIAIQCMYCFSYDFNQLIKLRKKD